jgi:lipopolysaccharide assembly protein A
MRWVHLAVIVLFGVAISVFAVQNLQVLDIDFLRVTVRIRLAFLIIVVYVLGAFSGGSLWALLRRSYAGARSRTASSPTS